MHLTDHKIATIHHSTRTIWPIFTRVHDQLRMKNARYYSWHLHPLHKFVHWFVFLIVLLLVTTLIAAS